MPHESTHWLIAFIILLSREFSRVHKIGNASLIPIWPVREAFSLVINVFIKNQIKTLIERK